MQLVEEGIHQQTGHMGGFNFAKKTMDAVGKILDSRTMSVLDAFDPLPHADRYHRDIYGYGMMDTLTRSKWELQWIQMCHNSPTGCT